MALIHYLYIGHFIPEEGYIRFLDNKPAVTRPIDMSRLTVLLRNYLGANVTPDDLPATWAMSILPEYIVCNYYGSPIEALRFVADYAQQEGAMILDQGSFTLLTPDQVRQSATVLRPAQPA